MGQQRVNASLPRSQPAVSAASSQPRRRALAVNVREIICSLGAAGLVAAALVDAGRAPSLTRATSGFSGRSSTPRTTLRDDPPPLDRDELGFGGDTWALPPGLQAQVAFASPAGGEPRAAGRLRFAPKQGPPA